MIQTVTLAALGLVFDLYGTFWLAKSVIWRTQKQVELETMHFWDENSYNQLSQKISKIWGWVGFISLFVGFAMQFVGQVVIILISVKMFLFAVCLMLTFGLVFNKIIIGHFDKKVPQIFREKYGSLK